ncbi:MAG: hypothetical protein A3F72_21325 [Bacteroidetes bacterium RIFCSPLOWO2_12_FULL_35_15]|nr:MAG: hypothetical protein A3F72_21325 [Bacteroidetes bacterium RIFCSPLOWO2_12_FULL_35_15]
MQTQKTDLHFIVCSTLNFCPPLCNITGRIQSNRSHTYIFIYYFILLTCFSFVEKTYASDRSGKIDSLKQLIGKVESDSGKIGIFNALAFQMAFSNPDSAIYYANKSLALSEPHLKSTKEEERTKYLSLKSTSFHNLGVIYYYDGNDEKALNYYFKALEIRNKLSIEHPQLIKYKNDLADTYNNIGIAYKHKGEFEKALEYYLKVLMVYEEINKTNKGDFSSKTGIGAAYNNLGVVYTALGNYSEALQNHLKSLKIKEEIGDKSGIAYSYNNIGIVYEYQEDFDHALEYYFKSLKIRQETGNKMGIANSFNNIGNIYSGKKKHKEALEYLKMSVEIKEELGDKEGIAASYSNIGMLYFDLGGFQKNPDSAAIYYKNALFYLKEVLKMDEENNDKSGMATSDVNIGSVLTWLGRFEEAEEYLQRGLKLAMESDEKDLVKNAYMGLSELNSKTGNYKNAFEYHLLYSQIKDSLLNEESGKQIKEMSARFESEKKEKQILLLEKDKEKQEEARKRQQLFFLVAVAFSISIAIIAIIIFRTLKVTRNQKIVIEKQKHLVEEKQKEIIDSITYAKRLQEAILPPLELIKKQLPESFVLYKPKDIVAGDFYWMEVIDNIVFIAAADCTGHGVPGAMVSVVCSNALNRTVKEFGLRATGEILDKVTDLVLETFEKSSSDVKDGMDISLLAIKFPSPNEIDRQIRLQWSGANNPLWYVQNGNIKEITADKQPIGKQDKRKPFTTHTIEYSDYSVFYLFTDGLPDQFGGLKGKKFLYKRFKENLFSIYKLPMEEQQSNLEKTFQDWKGRLEQLDDITVIGIKI